MTIRGTRLCPNNPVENLSWDEAQVFIGRLNASRSDGYVYRLPTEAEWEFAARAGTSSAYSFGNDASQLSLYGWFDGNSGKQTHEVGSLRPNALGLYDMHGNVWQWVQDVYGDYERAPQINPQGPSSGLFRVIRGGGLGEDASKLRSANRSTNRWENGEIFLGFRLVRTR